MPDSLSKSGILTREPPTFRAPAVLDRSHTHHNATVFPITASFCCEPLAVNDGGIRHPDPVRLSCVELLLRMILGNDQRAAIAVPGTAVIPVFKRNAPRRA